MKDKSAVFLSDYQAPQFSINKTFLDFKIYDNYTIVSSKLFIKRLGEEENLKLNGEKLDCQKIKINGKTLIKNKYKISDDYLEILQVPKEFCLEIVVKIYPQNNKSLEGLYKSGKMFCTQNEPQGFRKITYFLDRPDLMSCYTTRIEADKSLYPYLLSNGNKIEEGKLKNNRHYCVWNDPFKKPCYLFALVAGKLEKITDTYTTKITKRKIQLEIFVDEGNGHRTKFAFQSLKRAMQWDEEKFGLEYDLDIYMIVAVDDFNMGAMENKGLNIFNSSCILAHQTSSTDSDFINIESIIAHEYFHNWTGNRITCRDWFQLTLKEGLTVFRDQEFTYDYHSKSNRIEDINIIRTSQFSEDDGPMSHPIQPKSYLEINNFYTTTIYRKGAEVIRMIKTFVGKKEFYKAINYYCQKYDGQAITTQDFLLAIEESTNYKLKNFSKWYDWAGTPKLHISSQYNQKEKIFLLKIKQQCPNKDGNKKKIFTLPFSFALISKEKKEEIIHKTLILEKEEQEWQFKQIQEFPIPSLLRDFSAPVKLEYSYTNDELRFLIINDKDAFSSYNASQIFYTKEIINIVKGGEQVSKEFLELTGKILDYPSKDLSFISLLLTLPSLSFLSNELEIFDFEKLADAQKKLIISLAKEHKNKLLKTFNKLQDYSLSFSTKAINQRKLKNTISYYLSHLKEENFSDFLFNEFSKLQTMEDKLWILRALYLYPQKNKNRQVVLKSFYDEWSHDKISINKWFAIQMSSSNANLRSLKELLVNSCFSIENPNNIWATIRAFVGNLSVFHSSNYGEHYKFLAEKILEIDTFNSNVSARLCYGFQHYKKFKGSRQSSMKASIERILGNNQLSKDAYEILNNTLN